MGIDMQIVIQYRIGMNGEWWDWAEVSGSPRYSFWRHCVEGDAVPLDGGWLGADFWSIEQEIRESQPDDESPASSPEYAALRALANLYGPNNARMKWRLT